jgi:hypothetical protein
MDCYRFFVLSYYCMKESQAELAGKSFTLLKSSILAAIDS